MPLTFLNATGNILVLFFIERLGRRYIILRMVPFMALSWLITAVGISFTDEEKSESMQDAGGKIAFAGLSCLLLTFSLGMGATPWVICSEIFPLHIIGTANSLAATTNWTTNAFISEIFVLVTEISVTAKVIVYLSLAVVTFCCFIFTYFLIPETAKLSIESNLTNILK